MSLEEKYKKKNVDIQKNIKAEIKNIKNGMSKRDLNQLNEILNELEKTLDNKSLPLSYPRIIVDTWDFQDKLGLELLDLADLYKRWK